MPKKIVQDDVETVLIDGTEYELVLPEDFAGLMKAIRIRDLIQDAIASSSPEYHNANLEEGLELQQTYIRFYMDEDVGEFDNRNLINNIAYLSKKNGLRIGELEKLLGLSAGYISRTAKESSSKKLSIDAVWKISKLFEVDMHSLLDLDLRIPNRNTDIVALFLAKLCYQTEHREQLWDDFGGASTSLDSHYASMKVFIPNEIGTVDYKPDRLVMSKRYKLRSDVYGCWVTDEKQLLMFEYGDPEADRAVGYDFIMVTTTSNNGKRKLEWEYAFSSTSDCTQTVYEYSETLMHAVIAQVMDTDVSDDVRDILTDYLK